MDDSRRFLRPEALAQLPGLELRARQIVEGFVSGMHGSPYQGVSVDFAEHREYTPGDDLRYVDWKVFGRSDKFFLKEFTDETNFNCHIVLDTSESMSYQSEQAAVTKLEYASWIAASIAWLIIRQRDAVGLALVNDSIDHIVRPSGQGGHLNQILKALHIAESGGQTAIGNLLGKLAERFQRRGLVILISDLFDDPTAIARGLQYFRHRRHDVSVIQVIDPAEQDFPFEGPMLFKGLEGTGDQFAEPGALKSAYCKEFENFVTDVRKGCRKLGFDHHLIRTTDPLDIALSAFFRGRNSQQSRH